MTTHNTRLIGVLAYPGGPNLQHSMLAAAVDQTGVDASIHLFSTQPKDIADPVEALRTLNASGVYLTGRFRESAGNVVDYLSDEAHGSGVINTITFSGEEGTGHNTEASALISLLEPYADQFARRSAVILGSGATARAAAYALIRHFRIRHVTIAARDPQHAQLLKQGYIGSKSESTVEACELFPPDIADQLVEARLIVNATTVGSNRTTGETPITLPNIFYPGQVVLDVIYDPVETRLMQDARSAGATVIGGKELMERQLALAFQLLTGEEVEDLEFPTIENGEESSGVEPSESENVEGSPEGRSDEGRDEMDGES